MKLVECVPNFSEGRRPEVINAIRDAIAAVDGVSVLDVSSAGEAQEAAATGALAWGARGAGRR